VWKTTDGFCFVTFTQHSSGVTGVTFTQTGKVVVSSSLDGSVRAFDMNKYCIVLLLLLLLSYAGDSGPLSQRSAHAEQYTQTNTNPSPDPNRYRRLCPDHNARIQKFIHYMAIAYSVI